MTRHHQKVWRSIVAATAAIYYLTLPLLSWAQCPPPGVFIGSEARINDPCGPDQICEPPPDPVILDNDDGDPPADDKAMRDPAIAAAIVNNCPLLVSAFSDWSLRTSPGSGLFSVGFARSTDLGVTWAPTHDIARLDLGPPAGTPWSTGGWLPEQRRPGLAVGGNGTIYMVGEDFREVAPTVDSQTSIWLAQSTDQGSTWSVIAVADATTPGPGRVAFVHPSVSADPAGAGVYVTWSRHDDNGTSVWVVASADGGETFGSPIQISDYYLNRGDLVMSTSAVGVNGTFYAVWFEPDLDAPPTPDRYVMRRSLDGGATFDPFVDPATPSNSEPPRLVARFQGLSTNLFCSVFYSAFKPCRLDRPAVATDRRSCRADWVYVGFAADDAVWSTGNSDANVYLITSRDGGVTWDPGDVVMVNHPSLDPPTGHLPEQFGYPSQYLPAIASSAAGHVGVSFLNAKDDILGDLETPEIANQAYTLYLTYSTDGGCTFADECPAETSHSLPRRTDDPSDPGWAKDVGMTEYGGLTAYGRTFHAVWMSLRNWIGPPTFPPPTGWEGQRAINYNWVGDIYTSRVEVSNGAAPDFDADCDVDLADFLIFQQCFGGSNNPPAPTCPPGVNADMDPVPCGDGDVDLADFLIFQQCFTGSFTGCVGAGGSCSEGGSEGGAGPQGMSPAPESPPEPEPSPEQLRQRLEDWCLAHGIPFT